jgi:pilus assembly protein Flp/PilA
MNPNNNQGQGMIEYIILVAMVAIAAIGITELMGQSVRTKLSEITASLQGKSADSIGKNLPEVEERYYSRKGLWDFYRNTNKK